MKKFKKKQPNQYVKINENHEKLLDSVNQHRKYCEDMIEFHRKNLQTDIDFNDFFCRAMTILGAIWLAGLTFAFYNYSPPKQSLHFDVVEANNLCMNIEADCYNKMKNYVDANPSISLDQFTYCNSKVNACNNELQAMFSIEVNKK